MILAFNGKQPKIAGTAFIAPNATIIGDVTIEDGASIWFGAVLRGDCGPIVVGAGTSVQDNCVIHMTNSGTFIGEDVTVGHGAILHNCRIGRKSVIGMNSVVLDDAEIGEESVVAAGSIVTPRTVFPPRILITGNPARKKKDIEGSSLWWVQEASKVYKDLTKQYHSQGIGIWKEEDQG
ncbi:MULTISPECIES: gamma carbonic anhydrase family protein [Paenibacillus]|uniref:Acetyltransferase n=1 Tax=Paenibacillus naphthalenovorans TaxID=162209 RepID=A0A0U2W8D4_9BACL|nr:MULTISPECIES: gamma carbonic anhydrase family protein [Paenibacillus]ALS23677.1 acetyltransferase [Paenibacillus naphthalenovorans]NTZ19359.1 gamma carbonic anhydrase family protein [Paenibacillus sp. JMULE4]GCL73516.1 gamma carbonic anhydrase family protein [Paenibacillus naphthalenovorans]SDJ37972.1 Carbonic anhydrase or acetyltransferase, isoleucine patch superfamily [Paenibacillus naphthalenovorans]